jgi:hypothetical protein
MPSVSVEVRGGVETPLRRNPPIDANLFPFGSFDFSLASFGAAWKGDSGPFFRGKIGVIIHLEYLHASLSASFP